MKKLIIVLCLLGASASAVDPSWRVNDDFLITKKYDKVSKCHTYVVTQDDEAFTGLFSGGANTKALALLKGTEYKNLSGWNIGDGKCYILLCERKNKPNCFIHLKRDGEITFICNVDLPEPKVVEKIVEKIVYIEKGTPIPKPEVKVNTNGLYYDDFEEYYNHKYKN